MLSVLFVLKDSYILLTQNEISQISIFLSIIVLGSEHQYNGLSNQCITIATQWHGSFFGCKKVILSWGLASLRVFTFNFQLIKKS